MNDLGIKYAVNRFDDNNDTCYTNKCAFYKNRKVFHLAMPIGVVIIAGQGSKVNAVKCKGTGYHVNYTFGGIGKYKIGVGYKKGAKLHYHEHNTGNKRY